MRRDMLGMITAALAGTALAGPVMAQNQMNFCETGFAPADTNEDGTLNQSEIETLRAHEFGALDENADGTVTLEEYTGCLQQAAAQEMAPRNVTPTGSGELDPSGMTVELAGLEDGSLTRDEFMQAAEQAHDATGNQEDNQIEWARAFALIRAGNEETDIREMARDEFAARAAALFNRLDLDGSDDLSPEEWVGESTGESDLSGRMESAFGALDADTSGDVTQDEYAKAGLERAARAREAAVAAGWEDHGDYSGGVETDAVEGEVVATGSEGLASEGAGVTEEDAAEVGAVAADTAPVASTTEGGASAEPDPDAMAEAAETQTEDGAEGPSGTVEVNDAGSSAGDTGTGVPAFQYRFGAGN